MKNKLCAYKSAKTVKYAHKVALRTGIYCIYFAFGIGIFVLHILFASYKRIINKPF